MIAKDLNESWNRLPEQVKRNKIDAALENEADREIGMLKVFNYSSHSEVIAFDTIFYFDTEEHAVNYCLDNYRNQI